MPTIVFLDPSSVAMGGPDSYLTVYGSGFSPSSVVQWNGSTLATTFVSGTLVYAVVSASYRSASGAASVAVFNPTPGGGLSDACPVFIGPIPQPPAGIGVIQLVSAAPDSTPGNGHTYTPPDVSADGRYVAFQSDSTNLVPGTAIRTRINKGTYVTMRWHTSIGGMPCSLDSYACIRVRLAI